MAAGKMPLGAALGRAARFGPIVSALVICATCASTAFAAGRVTLQGTRAEPGSSFGASVAMREKTAVVGAPGWVSSVGMVNVFAESGSAWTEQAPITPPEPAPNEYFGDSVAFNGKTLVVGAPGRDGNRGAVYVYTRGIGEGFSEPVELTASDGAANDSLGVQVALSGSTIVAGAPGKSFGRGAAYVFIRSGSKWKQQAELTVSGGGSLGEFGAAVAIAGPEVVVGAQQESAGESGINSGAAYVFTRSGSTWSQRAELRSAAPAEAEYFGWSVAISRSSVGSTVAVGAPCFEVCERATGVVTVFSGSGSTWTQQAELSAPLPARDDSFGSYVELRGSKALVGADGTKSMNGAAYEFRRSGSSWSERMILSPAIEDGGAFGASVAFATGTTAVIGAPWTASKTGAAYVFSGL
jgi:hypothetical protein